ncbi:MAG: cytochrome c oxidase, subunit [Dehalococcoidia bacterium]|nr:cytochrome c oxidase, subunit [Dehalococcoidia bacterium]
MIFRCKNTLKLLAVLSLAIVILSFGCAKTPEQPPTPPSTPAPTVVQPTTPPSTGTGATKPAGDPAAGEKVFNAQGCNACHVAKGSGGQVGPKLDGIWGSKIKLTNGQEVAVDESYVRESIVSPSAKVVAGYQPIMPTSYASLPAQDLQNLISFTASLTK